MKVFISQPMRGIPDDEIKDIRNLELERLYEKGFIPRDATIIDQILPPENPEGANVRIWCLGRSLQMMAEADLVVFIGDWENSNGCIAEHGICELYRIPMLIL